MFFRFSSTVISRCLNPKKPFGVRYSHFYAIKQTNKKLLRVSGEESFIYLQSLLTNDLRHLMDGREVPVRGCVYAFMLSGLGKVLADVFVYKGKLLSEGELIVEVDSSLANAMRRLLISYNINRKISVEFATDLDLWTLIPKSHDINFFNNNDFLLKEVVSDDFQLVNDPRIPQMGYRLLTRFGGKTFDEVLNFIEDKRVEEGNVEHYKSYRFRLGVAEGSEDLLSGHFYPFECNGDYMNAISLDKGLYTSEEKAFDVYMKKPIRMRIMPIEFQCSKAELSQHSPPPFTTISSKYSRNLGTLRNRKGFNGIASLKVLHNSVPIKLNALYHTESGLRLKTWKPEWWPENINQIYFPKKEYHQNLFNIIPV